MSDDLVKLLRRPYGNLTFAEKKEVADRIEELEAENHLLKNSGIVEVAVRNPNVMEYMRHWEGRAEAAEAKLAKAVEFISNLKQYAVAIDDRHLHGKTVATLKELTGGKDE